MKIALGQLTSRRDIEDNLNTCREMVTRASAQGAGWVLFPENAPFLGKDTEKPDIAEPVDGPIVDAYRKMASDHGVWVTVGSIPEKVDGDTRTYNTQVMIDPSGEIGGVYRKIHMFDVEIEGGISYVESEGVKSGTEPVATTMTIDGEEVGVGLSVCYDLRFPELYRALIDQGAKIVTVPSAFTLQTGRDHWHPLLRARAIENQCWVIAPAQFGHHFGRRWSYGHSCVYDPWGRMVACASDRIGLTFADIDLDYLDEVRRKMPCLDHRKL